jgi:hypothetical protein
MHCGKIILIVILALLTAACKPDPGLALEKGWVRALPPGSQMTAAYGTLTNQTGYAIELTAYRSDRFGSVSLHRTVVEDGVSSMKPQAAIRLEPGSSITLEPGGLHLMLMRPANDVSAGDWVELAVITSNGEEFMFSLPVQAR